MTSRWSVRAAVFLSGAVLMTGRLQADDDSPAGLNQILEQQNARISALEGQNSALARRISQGPRIAADSGWEAGVGLYFLQPHFDDATAMTRIQTVNLGGGNSINTSERLLSFAFATAPKIWAAHSTDNGWMFRGDYFRLDATDGIDSHVSPNTSNSTTRVVIPSISAASDDVLTGGFGIPRQGVIVVDAAAAGSNAYTQIKIESRVVLDVADLDALRRLEMLGCQIRLGGGARFAHLDQTFNAYTSGTIPAGATLNQRMDLENSFQGGGPQAIIELRRSLGQLGIYGNARGGVLFGQAIQDQRIRVQAVNNAGGTLLLTGFERDHTAFDSVPFVDLEAGFDWSAELGPVAPFATVGVVAQQWFGVGSPTQTANNKSGDLGLFGLQISAGIGF